MVFFSLVNKYFGGEGLVSADHTVSTAIELLHIPASTNVVCVTEPNLGKDKFPKVWNLIDSLPFPEPTTLSSEEALKKIESSLLSAAQEGVLPDDPTGLKVGQQVTIDSLE